MFVRRNLALLAMAGTFAVAATTLAQAPTPAKASNIQDTYKDIQKTMGVVPQFARQFPEAGLPAAWAQVKGFLFNPDTALKPPMKDLLMLAVDAQTPCRFCSIMDREFSKVDKVTAAKQSEAIAMAAQTRLWSTFLNGMQMDEGSFKREVDQIMAFVRTQMQTKQAAGTTGDSVVMSPPKPMMDVSQISTPDQAYEDIRQTLGSVPTFLQIYPKEAIVGAWREMKTLQLSPNTAISPKDKELIGLAVASQIPCRYCAYFHTQAAKLNGATDREITETVATAGMVRHWSTVIEGAVEDEPTFRREAQQISRYLMAHPMPASKQMSGEIPVAEAPKDAD